MSCWWLRLWSVPRQVVWKFLIKYCIPSRWSITTHLNFLSFPEQRIKSRDLKIIEAGNSVCSFVNDRLNEGVNSPKVKAVFEIVFFWSYQSSLGKLPHPLSQCSDCISHLYFGCCVFPHPFFMPFPASVPYIFLVLVLQKLERVSWNVLACFSLKSHLCHRLRKSENNQNTS